MHNLEFKTLLFKVAFCTMACDGYIDEREIEELKQMGNNSSFFGGIDLKVELSQAIKELQTKGAKVIEELLGGLKLTKLNPIRELLILEVALRIINADKKIDENEIKFLHLLRAKLRIHDETIIDRFGELDILHTNKYSKNVRNGKLNVEFLENVNLTDLNGLSDEIITNL